jgi:hypothetical protein
MTFVCGSFKKSNKKVNLTNNCEIGEGRNGRSGGNLANNYVINI